MTTRGKSSPPPPRRPFRSRVGRAIPSARPTRRTRRRPANQRFVVLAHLLTRCSGRRANISTLVRGSASNATAKEAVNCTNLRANTKIWTSAVISQNTCLINLAMTKLDKFKIWYCTTHLLIVSSKMAMCNR